MLNIWQECPPGYTEFPLVLETPYAACELLSDYIGPKPLDHPGVVVAIREVVIQGGEAVALAGGLHFAQLRLIKLRCVDVSPIVGG